MFYDTGMYRFSFRLLAFSAFLLLPSGLVLAQALMLPPRPTVSSSTGACEGFAISAISDRWRVTKGTEFRVIAVQPFNKHSKVEFNWSVTNGQILNGQGTEAITVKPGKVKTKGFSNLSGIVEINLVASGIYKDDVRCSVSTTTQVMVGRFGEARANVYDLLLDESKLVLPCSHGSVPRDGQDVSADMVLDVEAIASDAENDVLTYNYSVSSGKIIGDGDKVRWDLTGAAPGSYTISSSVDDGCGACGSTVTRTVTVHACENYDHLECARLSIIPPKVAEPSRLYNFVAETELTTYDLEYEWSVINGEIVGDSKSRSVRVRAPIDPSGFEPTITIRIRPEDSARKFKRFVKLVEDSCPAEESFTLPKEWYSRP